MGEKVWLNFNDFRSWIRLRWNDPWGCSHPGRARPLKCSALWLPHQLAVVRLLGVWRGPNYNQLCSCLRDDDTSLQFMLSSSFWSFERTQDDSGKGFLFAMWRWSLLGCSICRKRASQQAISDPFSPLSTPVHTQIHANTRSEVKRGAKPWEKVFVNQSLITYTKHQSFHHVRHAIKAQ